MRFIGRVLKVGRYWAIEVPILGVVTQGRTRKEGFEMITDAVAALTALLLRRLRVKHGLTLSDVTRRMGARSLNSYARYEQGRSVSSIARLSQLLGAVSQGGEFVLTESRARRVA